MTQPPDVTRQLGDLDDRLSVAEINDYETETNLRLAGEAIRLLRGVVADLVGALPEDEQAEYADDLDRIDQIGHLLL